MGWPPTQFKRAIINFECVRRGVRTKMTPFRRYIKTIVHAKCSLDYWKRNPELSWNSTVVSQVRVKKQEKTARQLKYEFFMEHNEEVLTSRGADLDALAEHFEVDQNLPTQEKQEQVTQTMADAYIHGDSGWTREKILRTKKLFLEHIEKAHFPNLTCRMLDLKESLYRTWIRTDPDFAESVKSAQLRFGERIAHTLMVSAINGDLGAQMYALKQFGDAVKFIDPELEGAAAQTSGISVETLSIEEQETLLRLLRKAKDGGDSEVPTHFIESDVDVPPALIDETTKAEEPAVFKESEDDDSQNTIEYCGD